MGTSISGIVGRLLRLVILIGAIVVAVKVGAWLLSGISADGIGITLVQPTPVIVGVTPVVQPDLTANLTRNAAPIAAGIAIFVLLAVIGLLLVRRLRRPKLNRPASIDQPLLPQTRGLPIYQPGALTRSARPGVITPNADVNSALDSGATVPQVTPKQTQRFRRPPAPETRPVSPATRPVSLDNTRPMPGAPPLTRPEWPPTPSYGTEYGAYASYDDLFPPPEPGEDQMIRDIFGTLGPSGLVEDAPTEKMEPKVSPRPDIPPAPARVHSPFGAGHKRRPMFNRRKAPRQRPE